MGLIQRHRPSHHVTSRLATLFPGELGPSASLPFSTPQYLENPASLDAQGILVDFDHEWILQNVHVLGGHGTQICGHEEGGRQHRPQGHLGPGLLEAEAKVPNEQLGAEERSGQLCPRQGPALSL